MSEKSRRGLPDGIVHDTVVAEALALLLILFFTKNPKYCIISLAGAAAGIASFRVLVRQADRILEKGKDKTMFFLTGLTKLLAIAGIFFVVSLLFGKGVVFFIQGLVMIYLGMASAGLRQTLGSGRHGT